MAQKRAPWMLTKSEQKRFEKQFKPKGYGVFKWTETGKYPKNNAIKIYKSRAAAEKFCDKNLGKNYVPRDIWD